MKSNGLRPRAAAAKILALAAVLAAMVAVFCGCGCYVRLRVKYHMACCTPASSQSAAELCTELKGMGYAGYVLQYGGKTYVAAAILSTAGAAADLAESITGIGLNCSSLALERVNFELETYRAEQNAGLYEYTISSLNGIVSDLVACTENIIAGRMEEVRASLREINGELNALFNQNPFDPFTAKLAYLADLSAQCAYGALLPRDIRLLAVAVADCVISVRLT